ncbi:hypothetical protein Z517_11897 [Fonsecaea pedrosoi CBS 271.37]|uniref:Uncharacterized protein n=1 Tax=Fonsecaea pedrosoi CBS 271.37 TaxID=1442368 RepID=A0A0D2G8L2_9EURO|nr:uncharacterized protein Z517_11897 [Fonsecaea pedrosoi CBS 271.37]KIW75125.1 hypothetical protein Z517_11897 [Fonsecaea pedrosoi CBS 271.37]
MPTSHEANHKHRFYQHHDHIKTDIATVEDATCRSSGVKEIQQVNGGWLINYDGDESDLKSFFREGSVWKRVFESDDDEVLCMKIVTPTKPEKLNQQ